MSEQADVSDIAEAVRIRLGGAEWDVAIFFTDLLRRARPYPIGVEVDTRSVPHSSPLAPSGFAVFGAGVRQAVAVVVRELVAHELTPAPARSAARRANRFSVPATSRAQSARPS